MKIFSAVLVIGLLAMGDVAWANKDSYICTVRVDTGFAKDKATALPGTVGVKITARIHDKPYCGGQTSGVIAIDPPALELKRKRGEASIHPSLVRNALQAALSSFLAFEIAAAQGSPMNRAIVLSRDSEPDAPKPQDFGFQATRPASVKADMPAAAQGKSGNKTTGYVCLARSRFLLGGDSTIPTVNDTHTFELLLNSKPFCLGKEIARREYELGPAMRPPRKAAERAFALSRRVNASAVMHAIYVSFIEAAMAGQLVTLEHDADGILRAVELRARPRDLVKEVKTIAMPAR